MNSKNVKHKKIKYNYKTLYFLNNSDDEKLNEYSHFLIGSITKILTAYIIIILQQKNLLNINDKVNKYINLKNDDYSKITILDLLNHTGKIKKNPDNFILKKYTCCKDILNNHINEKFITLKNDGYSYSNIGYVLLGYIIEKITGLDYLQVYKKYIFILQNQY